MFSNVFCSGRIDGRDSEQSLTVDGFVRSRELFHDGKLVKAVGAQLGATVYDNYAEIPFRY